MGDQLAAPAETDLSNQDAEKLSIGEAIERYSVTRTALKRRLGRGSIPGATKERGPRGDEWRIPVSFLDRMWPKTGSDPMEDVVPQVDSVEEEVDLSDPTPVEVEVVEAAPIEEEAVRAEQVPSLDESSDEESLPPLDDSEAGLVLAESVAAELNLTGESAGGAGVEQLAALVTQLANDLRTEREARRLEIAALTQDRDERDRERSEDQEKARLAGERAAILEARLEVEQRRAEELLDLERKRSNEYSNRVARSEAEIELLRSTLTARQLKRLARLPRN